MLFTVLSLLLLTSICSPHVTMLIIFNMPYAPFLLAETFLEALVGFGIISVLLANSYDIYSTVYWFVWDKDPLPISRAVTEIKRESRGLTKTFVIGQYIFCIWYSVPVSQLYETWFRMNCYMIQRLLL